MPDVPVPDGSDDAPLRPRGQKTRQLLLDAGTVVLPARGYHDARVDDIVDAAGVSHGSFYRYFENKEDFFRVLAEEASTRMVELLDAFPIDAPEAELRAWIRDWFATYESNGGVISTWQEMQPSDADLLSFGQQVAATVMARLMALLDERGFGDPLVDARRPARGGGATPLQRLHVALHQARRRDRRHGHDHPPRVPRPRRRPAPIVSSPAAHAGAC